MVIGGGGEERSGCCRGSKVTYQNKNRMEYKTSWWLGGKRESERERKKVKLWEWRSQNFVLIFRVQSNFGFDSLSFSLSPNSAFLGGIVFLVGWVTQRVRNSFPWWPFIRILTFFFFRWVFFILWHLSGWAFLSNLQFPVRLYIY